MANQFQVVDVGKLKVHLRQLGGIPGDWRYAKAIGLQCVGGN